MARFGLSPVDGWIRVYFSEDKVPEVLRVLSAYGSESWHNEPERVKRDAVIISRGSIEKLKETIKLAMTDYRDVLIGEEVDPWLMNQLKKVVQNNLPPAIHALEDLEHLRIVRLKGVIDLSTAEAIEAFRKGLIHQEGFVYKNLLVDLSNATDIDGASFMLAVNAIKDLKSNNQELGMVGAKTKHLGMIQLLKLDKWIKFYSSEQEALAQLNGASR